MIARCRDGQCAEGAGVVEKLNKLGQQGRAEVVTA
jgi:hypothetical protein